MNKAAMMRGSERRTELGILSPYMAPREVECPFGRSPETLPQLGPTRMGLDEPRGVGRVLQFVPHPVDWARAFLQKGREDSVAFRADLMLEQPHDRTAE